MRTTMKMTKGWRKKNRMKRRKWTTEDNGETPLGTNHAKTWYTFVWSFFRLGRVILVRRAWEDWNNNWIIIRIIIKASASQIQHLSSRNLFCLISLKVVTFWQGGFLPLDLFCLHTHIVRQLLIPSSLPAPQKSNNNFHTANCVPDHRGS